MSLKQLSELARAQLDAETALAEAEKNVKLRKDELKVIKEQMIPELMDEMGMEDFTTTEGIKITVKEDIRASITAANAPEAFRWLRDNGHANLIKRKITVTPANDEQGTEVLDRLAGLEVEDKPSVHPMTLSAWVREMLRDGKDIPMEPFGVFRQRVSKVEVK